MLSGLALLLIYRRSLFAELGLPVGRPHQSQKSGCSTSESSLVLFSITLTTFHPSFAWLAPVEMRHPRCTLEQMLEYYEHERRMKSAPEIEQVKLDLTKIWI